MPLLGMFIIGIDDAPSLFELFRTIGRASCFQPKMITVAALPIPSCTDCPLLRTSWNSRVSIEAYTSMAFVMNDHRKYYALKAWERLFNHPAIRMDVEEQYEELLRLADDFQDQGIISPEERKELIEKATASYARSVEGVGEGT